MWSSWKEPLPPPEGKTMEEMEATGEKSKN